MSTLHEAMKTALSQSKFCKNVYRKLINKRKSLSQELCLVYACYLAEEGKIAESLNTLYYAIKNFNRHISCEKTASLIWKIVDHLKKENINNLSFQRDNFSCPNCMNILYEPLTFSCGHSYCKMCSQNGTLKACLVCNISLESAPEINVLVSSLVEKWWSKETKGVAMRRKGEALLKEKKYAKALKAFTEAYELVSSDHLLLCSRSKVNLLLGNDNDALRDACEATLRRPEWAKGYLCKSNALLALGREEDALVAMLVYAMLANLEDCERVYFEVAKLILLILRRSAVRAEGAHAFFSASKRDERCPKEVEKASTEILRAKRIKKRSSSIKTSLHHFITEDIPVVSKVLSRLSGEVSKIKKYVKTCHKLTVTDTVFHGSDFECPLCFLCFWKPVTTVCGHTFCLACLVRSLDHASQCPLCKTSLKAYNVVGNAPNVNEFVEHAMKTLVPKDFNERRLQHAYELRELSKAGQDLQHEMPIFVATMAIPTISCPLHVFEPRYRLMIRRVMEAGTREFGMCMPSPAGEKGFSNYGTLLKILEVKPFSDGRSIVHAVGARRFKCVTKSMRDGYNTSTIEYIEDKKVSDEDLPKLKLLHDVVNKRARMWFQTVECDMRQRILSHYGEMPSIESDYWLLADGPAWVWWMLAILPLEPSVQMRIIKEQRLTARLSQVSQALKYIVTHQSKTKQ